MGEGTGNVVGESTRSLAEATVRTGWGLALVAAPRAVLARNGPAPSRTAVTVARLLGVRHLGQVASALLAPTAAARPGALVDALHATTAAGLAVGSSRWRRFATADALLAAAFAAVGWSRRR